MGMDKKAIEQFLGEPVEEQSNTQRRNLNENKQTLNENAQTVADNFQGSIDDDMVPSNVDSVAYHLGFALAHAYKGKTANSKKILNAFKQGMDDVSDIYD